MNLRNRKLRLGIVLALAVFAAYFAWRTGEGGSIKTCSPGRQEVKDDSGKVVSIKRTTCAGG